MAEAQAVSRPSRAFRWETAAGLFSYSGTLFVSALLVFSLQPMFARMVLPALGGTPAVWAVSLCFFQVTLLAGYCYAHLLNRFVPLHLAPILHALVLIAAVSALPVAVPAAAAAPPPGSEYLWLIEVLALGAGLPFFAVSATAPLLQAWFSHTRSPHSADPYFLYAASNAGSLFGLLSYPFLAEPLLGLSDQSGIWSAAFLALTSMIALCGLQLLRDSTAEAADDLSLAEKADAASIGWRQRLRWIGCSLVPSGLLIALTSFITTDVASAPFLWVLPLAVYLATFIAVFRDRELISQAALLDRLPLVVAALVLVTSCSSAFPLPIAFGVGFLAFTVIALALHRELYLSRPPASHLTEFYLWISVGGALGGIFAALVAPQIFTTIFELPLLAVLCLLASPLVLHDRAWSKALPRALIYAAAALAVVILANLAVANGLIAGSSTLRLAVLCSLLVPLFLLQNAPRLQAGVLVFMLLAAPFLPEECSVRYGTRSFYGSLRVMEAEGGAVRAFRHGTTMHGAQRLRRADGSPIDPPVPGQYYHPEGPLARSVEAARHASGKPAGDFRAGIVGLGIGAMACYARPNETWRFYEIDPAVIALARNPDQFTYLARCQPNADIVAGDARLTVGKETPGSFDYLLLDAFSSDAVPTHLLTVQALRMYLDKLGPRGLLVLHVSNRHLDLVPVVIAAAQKIPGAHAFVAWDDTPPVEYDKAPSVAVMITKGSPSVLASWRNAAPAPPTSVRAWTDDYADVLSALWRRYAR
jgi:hypothetical protein